MMIGLSSCQAPSPAWTKTGASTANLRHDLADCERVGTGLPSYHFWALNENYQRARDRIARLRNECMEARGWQPL